MSRDIDADPDRPTVYLPKSVARHGSSQRDWIGSRIRRVRRVTFVLSFAAGTLFTGLALRHSTQPGGTVSAAGTQTAAQSQQSPGQSPNAPSQSLFDDQTSGNFSIAPAPAPSSRVSSPRVRTSSS
jgi:hypothetical protein